MMIYSNNPATLEEALRMMRARGGKFILYVEATALKLVGYSEQLYQRRYWENSLIAVYDQSVNKRMLSADIAYGVRMLRTEAHMLSAECHRHACGVPYSGMPIAHLVGLRA